MEKATTMQQGIVRVFFEDRGFGFIEPDGGGRSVFLHARDLQDAGIATPTATGTRLEFTIEKTAKGLKARDLRLLPGESDKEREVNEAWSEHRGLEVGEP